MKNVNSYFEHIDTSISIEMNSNINYQMPNFHFHDCYEIYFAGTGPMKYIVNNKLYDINPGDMLIINNMDLHRSIPPKDGPYNRTIILFNPDFISSFSTKDTDLLMIFNNHSPDFCHKISLNESQQAKFMELAQKAKELLKVVSFGIDLRQKIALIEILFFVNSLYMNSKMYLTNSNNKIVDTVLKYIHENIHENISLSDIENIVFMNKNYINKLFRDTIGMTVKQYIIQYRIALARKFLKRGLSVSETVQASGFGNISNFIRTFNNSIGITPKQYQKASQNNKVQLINKKKGI